MVAARVGSLVLALAATIALALPASSGGGRPSIATASPADLLRSAAPFRDAVLARAPGRVRQLALYERFYTTPDGVRIRFFISTSYAPREERNQALVDFLGWLPHGKELAQTRLYVLNASELRATCGPGAAACYSPVGESIYIPGDEDPDLPLAHVLAHEYGHHVARNRDNSPWFAGFFGPKRWATYMRVCPLAARGDVFPGDGGGNYALNPGEGWAEAYRRLSEERARQLPDPLLVGRWPDIGWRIVDDLFIPNEVALRIVQQDVVDPWTSRTRTTITGRLTRPVTRTIRTPLDGRVTAQIAGTAGATATVLDSRGRRLTRSGKGVTATVCGQQRLTVALTPKRTGSFRLTLLVP